MSDAKLLDCCPTVYLYTITGFVPDGTECGRLEIVEMWLPIEIDDTESFAQAATMVRNQTRETFPGLRVSRFQLLMRR